MTSQLGSIPQADKARPRAKAPPIVIAPSILSADFARLGDEVRAVDAAGADWIHVDVIDGRFVPNISIGPVVLEAIRRSTAKPLNVHLMVIEPERYLGVFAKAGADHLLVQAEREINREFFNFGPNRRLGVAIRPMIQRTYTKSH